MGKSQNSLKTSPSLERFWDARERKGMTRMQLQGVTGGLSLETQKLTPEKRGRRSRDRGWEAEEGEE